MMNGALMKKLHYIMSQNLELKVEELYQRWEQKITYHKEVTHFVLHDIMFTKQDRKLLSDFKI